MTYTCPNCCCHVRHIPGSYRGHGSVVVLNGEAHSLTELALFAKISRDAAYKRVLARSCFQNAPRGENEQKKAKREIREYFALANKFLQLPRGSL
jgi:hypothetical protein